MKYLVVIVPDRAGGREHGRSFTNLSSEDFSSDGKKSATSFSIKGTCPKSTSQSLQASPCPPQKTTHSSGANFGSSLTATSASSRLLSKHPAGDRHPNPDYQTRAKHQADLAKEIRYGLDEYEKGLKRQRHRSYTRLGFDFDFESDGYISSATDSFTDLSGFEDQFIVSKPNKVYN